MIIFGKQVVLFVARRYGHLVKSVMLAKEIEHKSFQALAKLNTKIIKLDQKKAQALSQGRNHQGYFLEIEDFIFTPLSDVKNGKFIVILDNITDIGNIGAIVRTSYALGVDAIIISGIKDLKMAHIVRSSAGSAFGIPIVLVANILDCINELKMEGFSIVCGDIKGVPIEHIKKIQLEKKVLILGSEDQGVAKKVLQRADHCLKIDMKNDFDSLNVSAAAAILIYALI